MALPNGSGGYQVGVGNPSEAVLGALNAITAYTGATGTIAVADLENGVFSVDPGSTSAGTYSFAAAADVDEAVSSARVDIAGIPFQSRCLATGSKIQSR